MANKTKMRWRKKNFDIAYWQYYYPQQIEMGGCWWLLYTRNSAYADKPAKRDVKMHQTLVLRPNQFLISYKWVLKTNSIEFLRSFNLSGE